LSAIAKYPQITMDWLNPLLLRNPLNDCAIVNDSSIIIVGNCGTFLISYDCGQLWLAKSLSSGCGTNLNAISFYDEHNGIIVEFK
jgi:photosystem II stability/assembly factor-like uncharacterized protein